MSVERLEKLLVALYERDRTALACCQQRVAQIDMRIDQLEKSRQDQRPPESATLEELRLLHLQSKQTRAATLKLRANRDLELASAHEARAKLKISFGKLTAFRLVSRKQGYL